MNALHNLRTLLAFCLALLCTAASAGNPQPQIVNGVTSKAWPGMGAILIIQGMSYFQCSAR